MKTKQSNMFGEIKITPRTEPSPTNEEESRLRAGATDGEIFVICVRHLPMFSISTSEVGNLFPGEGSFESGTENRLRYIEVANCPFCSEGFTDPKIKFLPVEQ